MHQGLLFPANLLQLAVKAEIVLLEVLTGRSCDNISVWLNCLSVGSVGHAGVRRWDEGFTDSFADCRFFLSSACGRHYSPVSHRDATLRLWVPPQQTFTFSKRERGGFKGTVPYLAEWLLWHIGVAEGEKTDKHEKSPRTSHVKTIKTQHWKGTMIQAYSF